LDLPNLFEEVIHHHITKAEEEEFVPKIIEEQLPKK